MKISECRNLLSRRIDSAKYEKKDFTALSIEDVSNIDFMLSKYEEILKSLKKISYKSGDNVELIMNVTSFELRKGKVVELDCLDKNLTDERGINTWKIKESIYAVSENVFKRI